MSSLFLVVLGASMSAYESSAYRALSNRASIHPAFVLIALSVSLPLIGCSIHPLPDDVSRSSTYDIVQKVRCEAKAAVEEYGRGFANASIVYNFTFNINEHNDASAGFTLLDPFKATGTSVNVVASGLSNRTREGIRN